MRTTVVPDSKARGTTTALMASLVVVILLPIGNAQSTVGLGTAGSFAILAGETITNTGPSVINGDIGLHPGSSATGLDEATVNGDIHLADAVAEQAKLDLGTAYDEAAGAAPATIHATELGGQTLTAGIYDSETNTFGLTGTLTLDAEGDPDAVWIFQAETTLVTASDSAVVLINGAQACNVFWQVGNSATLGTGTTFVGNILAHASITMNSNATLDGRALARTGAVTLINNMITVAECALPDDETPTECTTDLAASSGPDGSIRLTWRDAGAEGYLIHRAVSDGAFVLHDEVDANTTRFTDTDTEVGVLYRYQVAPIVEDGALEDCDVVEITAIPFFPGLLIGGLAVLAGVAGYALNRRRP